MEERPELGEIKQGDEVFVRRSFNESREQLPECRYIPARVVKVARVWIDLCADPARMSEDVDRINLARKAWRMRRDTQDEGDRQYTQRNASFLTPAQREWEDRLSDAKQYLKEQGIEIKGWVGIKHDAPGPWRGREVELAALLRKAQP